MYTGKIKEIKEDLIYAFKKLNIIKEKIYEK